MKYILEEHLGNGYGDIKEFNNLDKALTYAKKCVQCNLWDDNRNLIYYKE